MTYPPLFIYCPVDAPEGADENCPINLNFCRAIVKTQFIHYPSGVWKNIETPPDDGKKVDWLIKFIFQGDGNREVSITWTFNTKEDRDKVYEHLRDMLDSARLDKAAKAKG